MTGQQLTLFAPQGDDVADATALGETERVGGTWRFLANMTRPDALAHVRARPDYRIGEPRAAGGASLKQVIGWKCVGVYRRGPLLDWRTLPGWTIE